MDFDFRPLRCKTSKILIIWNRIWVYALIVEKFVSVNACTLLTLSHAISLIAQRKQLNQRSVLRTLY